MQEQPEQADTPARNSEPAAQKPVDHLEFKARLLLAFTVLLIAGSALYLLYARGVFEPTQKLVLTTDDSEGVVAGMDMTFSGFAIGRVRGVELAKDGNVHITVDVARSDAHWLRTTSVFTLVRSLVGSTNLRAFSGVLTDPPLADGAVRPVLRGDATAEIPRVIAAAKDALDNVTALTAQDAALGASLANVKALTDKLKGPQGALGAVFGNEADARKLVAALDNTNALLLRLDTLTQRVDGLAAKADTQVFGEQGLVTDARATVQQLNGLLADTRASLKKMDAVLADVQAVGANVRSATDDLGALRGDVEANLRKIDGLINEINRKWPFARDTQIKLP
ncbi:mammalian cell entry protein [uncultured Ramlibacter sp.]|uniref:MlaD family protein n=1 Tax=uncultured Ramlibacter sp. TaxID=260755 RepID=UPI00261E8083|nr:mammalian cell entry protein [uncultured Ramlibacter sp.]